MFALTKNYKNLFMSFIKNEFSEVAIANTITNEAKDDNDKISILSNDNDIQNALIKIQNIFNTQLELNEEDKKEVIKKWLGDNATDLSDNGIIDKQVLELSTKMQKNNATKEEIKTSTITALNQYKDLIDGAIYTKNMDTDNNNLNVVENIGNGIFNRIAKIFNNKKGKELQIDQEKQAVTVDNIVAEKKQAVTVDPEGNVVTVDTTNGGAATVNAPTMNATLIGKPEDKQVMNATLIGGAATVDTTNGGVVTVNKGIPEKEITEVERKARVMSLIKKYRGEAGTETKYEKSDVVKELYDTTINISRKTTQEEMNIFENAMNIIDNQNTVKESTKEAENNQNTVKESTKEAENNQNTAKETVSETYTEIKDSIIELFKDNEINHFTGVNGKRIEIEYSEKNNLISLDTSWMDNVEDYDLTGIPKNVDTIAEAKKHVIDTKETIKQAYNTKVKENAIKKVMKEDNEGSISSVIGTLKHEASGKTLPVVISKDFSGIYVTVDSPMWGDGVSDKDVQQRIGLAGEKYDKSGGTKTTIEVADIDAAVIAAEAEYIRLYALANNIEKNKS